MEIPKVFVISPKEMPERRRVTERHLESVGLHPVMFAGLYGENIDLYASIRGAVRSSNPVLTPGIVTLAFNHWFLWQHMVLANIPQAIIFEDDVVLPSNFESFFSERMAETPTDWEMVYLSILFPERMAEGKIGVEKVSENVYRHVAARSWDGATDGLHAYMMNLSGAKKALDVKFTLNEPMDRWVSFNVSPFVRTYIWHPSPIRQRSASGEWKSTLLKEGLLR